MRCCIGWSGSERRRIPVVPESRRRPLDPDQRMSRVAGDTDEREF